MWNERGLLQGRHDARLSPSGLAEARSWQLPARYAAAPIYSSPLRRAIATAEMISGAEPLIDTRLIEMDWGEFEGERLDALRRKNPKDMAAREARGTGFDPPGGERPIDVAARLRSFLRDLDRPSVIVTHKGVMHAALILGLGWDMRSKPPVRLRFGTALELSLDADRCVAGIHPVVL